MTLVRADAPKSLTTQAVKLLDRDFPLAHPEADVSGCLPGRPFYGINREPSDADWRHQASLQAQQGQQLQHGGLGAHYGQMIRDAAAKLAAPVLLAPPCNHEAELTALRSSAETKTLRIVELSRELEDMRADRQLNRQEVYHLRDLCGNKDHEIAKLEREVGRQALELRRAGKSK